MGSEAEAFPVCGSASIAAVANAWVKPALLVALDWK